jgi:hypothetical protein
MGIPTFFILVLFLRIFQFFYSLSKPSIFLDGFCRFFLFFYFFTKKTSVALAGYGFACLDFACPRSITSGLLYSEDTLNLKITSGLFGHGDPNSIKNYSQFSVFGGSHD